MKSRRPTIAELALPGLIAGALFSLAAARLGRRDSDSAAAALNAPSHVIWGDSAFAERRFAARYTLPGIVINTGAGLFWAAVMRMLFRGSARRSLPSLLVGGTATSSLAWLIDYGLIPRRLSPGIQELVSRRSLLTIHGLFALGLALGTRLVGPPEKR